MDAATLLAGLPGWAFAFALVLARSSAAVMLLPGLGEADPPPMVRAGLAAAFTGLLLPVLLPQMPPVPSSAWRLGGMIAAELLSGAVLGWLARLVALSLPIAGGIISLLLGVASVLQPDPALGGQSTAVSRLLGLAVPVLVLSTGLYALPLQALVGSYQLVPPGTWLPAGGAAESVTGAVAEGFALALRLAAPFVLAGVLVQAGLGLVARLVPQMQVYATAVPGQILAGLALLALLSLPLLGAWQDAVQAAWQMLPGL
jgi:flagellar biosynthesis protein FliR